MRVIGVTAVLAAALLAGPASAQDASMNNTMAVPMPGTELDNDGVIRAISERTSRAEEERARREQRAAMFGQRAVERREEARQQAAALASATPPSAGLAGDIREALEQDLRDWRSQFDVGRREWQAMRQTWLPAEASLTADEWAAHRLNWFTARDAWIAERGSGS